MRVFGFGTAAQKVSKKPILRIALQLSPPGPEKGATVTGRQALSELFGSSQQLQEGCWPGATLGLPPGRPPLLRAGKEQRGCARESPPWPWCADGSHCDRAERGS